MLRPYGRWFTCMLALLWPVGVVAAQAPTNPAFEVASVRSNTSDAPADSRVPLGPGDAYAPGGLFSATNQPLIVYIRFAYKRSQSDLLRLPAWVYNDRFNIEARAQGNPTKDQMRLMMRSLLAERFKLVTHTERQTKPLFELVVAKAGKTGPQLRAHANDGSCAAASTPPPAGTAAAAAPSEPSSTSGVQLPPIACGSMGVIPASAPGRARIGGRRVALRQLAEFLTNNTYAGVDRPVRDRTGLAGTYDFSVEWTVPPEPGAATSPQLDDAGSTFAEALQKQLGLRLKSVKGPVDVLIFDHVERPTEK